MTKFTKKESQLIVNHVCACIKKLKVTQEKLCGELDPPLDTSLFTKTKQGKKRLSDEYLSQLVELFGYPRIGKGIFVEAEHYDGLNEFLDTYEDTQLARFTNRQIQIWQNAEFIESLLRSFVIIEKKAIENSNNFTDNKTYVLGQLQSMLKDEAFKNWFDLYEPKAHSSALKKVLFDIKESPTEPTLEAILAVYNIRCLPEFPKEALLQRLGMMNYLVDSIYEFDISHQTLFPIPIEKELVISGEQVLNERISLNTFIDKTSRKFDSLIKQFSLIDEITLLEPNSKIRLIIRDYLINHDHVESWQYVQFQIFLGTEMGYHLLLSFEGKTSRKVVISLKNNNEIIDTIIELHKFFGLKNIIISAIKNSLAEAGGYIPGTTLLT
ncbi:hypothetical protein Q4591_18675 [Shewanella sp. 3_MG-2023]|uniref:hypothetical protein n=1 Tax=Shewanella sp. 3_MG-2023 TaxID=3062635 RepID=UPI0026E125D4|nr:hypothetical protein [Shewanella sp. 3_MG-2023]MDO6777369.1 hypothetical protein [Shewanella sp. 3_MG-2023]